jgi:hypothetical protein
MVNLQRKGVQVKRILFALLIMASSTTVFADAGLFFDGTAKYARTGVIQSSFPDVQLISCPNFKSCDKYLVSHQNVAIVFADIAEMKAEVKKRAKVIASISAIRTVAYKGFKIVEADILDDDGRNFVMLGVKTPKKTSTPEKNIAIAEALVAEFTAAYARIGQ